MVFVCKMCESSSVYITYICEECRRIRHMMNLYSKERVLEVLDTVLVRNDAGIKNKSDDLKIKGDLSVSETTQNTITTRSKKVLPITSTESLPKKI